MIFVIDIYFSDTISHRHTMDILFKRYSQLIFIILLSTLDNRHFGQRGQWLVSKFIMSFSSGLGSHLLVFLQV